MSIQCNESNDDRYTYLRFVGIAFVSVSFVRTSNTVVCRRSIWSSQKSCLYTYVSAKSEALTSFPFFYDYDRLGGESSVSCLSLSESFASKTCTEGQRNRFYLIWVELYWTIDRNESKERYLCYFNFMFSKEGRQTHFSCLFPLFRDVIVFYDSTSRSIFFFVGFLDVISVIVVCDYNHRTVIAADPVDLQSSKMSRTMCLSTASHWWLEVEFYFFKDEIRYFLKWKMSKTKKKMFSSSKSYFQMMT